MAIQILIVVTIIMMKWNSNKELVKWTKKWHSNLEQRTPKNQSYRLWWGAAAMPNGSYIDIMI